MNDQVGNLRRDLEQGKVSRREFFKIAGALGLAPTAASLLAACGGQPAAGPTAAPAATEPSRGGRLLVGISGGSEKDTLDAHRATSEIDIARNKQLYEGLVAYDTDYQIENVLAEELTPNDSANEWVVRLKEGIEFHNGKILTADDVVWSFRRIIDPDDPTSGAKILSNLSPEGITKVDDRTVKFALDEPSAVFDDQLAQRHNVIVPEGYDPSSPVGTGPFKYSSFTPGQQSVFPRHENYWRDGQPYVDEVVIIGFQDDTARVNALVGGQVQAINSLPFGEIAATEQDSSLEVLVSKGGGWVPILMAVDMEPFDDVRVRQACRLIVDRQQMIDQALSGQGWIGNDLYSPWDPCYASDLPQRGQDLNEAKSLLKSAGVSEVTLVTSPASGGMVEACEVFAEQAKGAGLNVVLRKVPSSEFWSDYYLKYAFSTSFWFTRNIIPQSFQCMVTGAPFNETHFDDPTFNGLLEDARSTVDRSKRCDPLHEAQKILYETGGYIIWGFKNNVDAYASNLEGFIPDKSGISLTSYRFREARFV